LEKKGDRLREDYPTISITRFTPKERILEIGNDCERCGHCCRYGSGFLVDEDIPKIARHLGLTEEELKQNCLEEVEKFHTKRFRPRVVRNGKPYGTCIFYNTQEGCIIHGIKPFQCKIGNCNKYGQQINDWFVLNYFVNTDDPESIREWASYLKMNPTIPGGELHELVPDKKKLKKILSYEVIR
jgi:Fe-S-cluster containining protein